MVKIKLTGRRFTLAGVSLVSAAALTALVLPGTGSAKAAAGSWPSQLARPAKAACPRGQALIAPTSGWTDKLGVAHVTYNSDPGLVAVVPPRGLTAGKATPALLADVGLSARQSPSSPARQRSVKQLLHLAKNRAAPEFCWDPAPPAEADQPLRSPAGQPSLKNAHVFSGNWGGYAVTEAEYGNMINAAYGTWTVPRSLTSSAPSAESTWVGLGGGLGEQSSVNGLIQGGSSMQTNLGYRSWYEAIGSSGCTIHTHFCGKYSSVDAIQPGDTMTTEVYWENTTSACFYVTDWTRTSGDWSVCTPVSIPYDHTSAEWVNENHLSDGFYYDSPGTVHWTDQYLTSSFNASGSWSSPFSGSYEGVVMEWTSAAGTSCSSSGVLSVPINPATTSSGGSSDIATCSVGGIDSP